jgi:uncharacterized RDD family membrane protein YckC
MEDKNLLKSASILRRIAAFTIDWILVSLVLNFLLIPAGLVLGMVSGISISSLFSIEEIMQTLPLMAPLQVMSLLIGVLLVLLVSLIIWHLYFILMEYKFKATIGKKVLGLKVISLDSETLSYKQCLVREIFRSYSDVPLIFPGIVCMFMSKRKQRLGDILTETMVIKGDG